MGLSHAIHLVFSVLVLVACVPQIAAAQERTALPQSLPKAFAVFVLASNQKGEARGGVAGTAFFVSSRKAITAYHVLQKKSFELQPGFSRQRVWLVHEGEPAIELQETQVTFDSKNDLTFITLDHDVSPNYVYPFGNEVRVGSQVTTEGFVAETAGPILVRLNGNIEISSVPKLVRRTLQGEVVTAARLQLKALDVQLESTPCFQTTYEPIRGISGGPMLVDGRVVGMNSFADPQLAHRTWAVVLERSTETSVTNATP
jgi:Trypsin-like peptidase domain